MDFLLCRVQEPIAGSVYKWVQEHQNRLQVVFEGAQGQLKIMADKRKAKHDLQLVYLQDYGNRGRHKIQDL